MDHDDDIGSEWATLKSVPKAKAVAPDVNLRLDILDARQTHPDFIYRVHEGYGLNSMALWRSRCHAKKHLEHGRGYPRDKNVYIYSLDKLLFAGREYKPHASETPTKTYSSPCSAFHDTLEAALVQWEQAKQKHIATAREQAARHRKEAADRLEWAATYEAEADAAEKTQLRAEDLDDT